MVWRKRPVSKYMQISLYVFGTATAILLVWRLLTGWSDMAGELGAIFLVLIGALRPIAVAFIVAYLMLFLVQPLERLLARLIPRARARRLFSALIVYLLAFLLAGFGVSYIFPNLYQNLKDLVNGMPAFIVQAQNFIRTFEGSDFLKDPQVTAFLQALILRIRTLAETQFEQWISAALNYMLRIIGNIVQFLFAVLISFYIVLEKESLLATCRSAFLALLGPKRISGMSVVLKDLDSAVGKYVAARLLESLIIIALCVGIFAFFGVPYYILLAVIIGIFNLVPYIGPLAAGIVTVFISLFSGLDVALTVLIVNLLIEVVDSFVISPKLFSKNVGINTFWVIAALTVGSALFGVLGMLLAVPIAGVIHLAWQRMQNRRREAGAGGASGGADA